MKALVFDGTLRITDVPMPVPEPGEALIRILVAGICNTDIEIRRGYMNYAGILGHEFVGIVEKAENKFLLGKRVVGEINCVCGRCRFCKMEMPRHCNKRSVMGIYQRPGAFAEYATLPEANLHIVPDAMHDEVAVFTEPLAAAFRITEQITLTENDRVIVMGDGKLGQLTAQTLWLYSRHLLCVGKHPWKLALLAARGIPTSCMDATIQGDADVVVEATGRPDGLERALSLVRPEGTVFLKTTCAAPLQADSQTLVVNEVRVLGSRCGPFRPALEALALGTVETRPMVTESHALADGVHALARAEEPGVMKVLLHV